VKVMTTTDLRAASASCSTVFAFGGFGGSCLPASPAHELTTVNNTTPTACHVRGMVRSPCEKNRLRLRATPQPARKGMLGGAVHLPFLPLSSSDFIGGAFSSARYASGSMSSMR